MHIVVVVVAVVDDLVGHTIIPKSLLHYTIIHRRIVESEWQPVGRSVVRLVFESSRIEDGDDGMDW